MIEANVCDAVHMLTPPHLHHALAISWGNLDAAAQGEINASRLEFNGYSRSQERELADYVCFLLEVDKRFPELKCPCDELSSDIAMRDKYNLETSWLTISFFKS